MLIPPFPPRVPCCTSRTHCWKAPSSHQTTRPSAPLPPSTMASCWAAMTAFSACTRRERTHSPTSKTTSYSITQHRDSIRENYNMALRSTCLASHHNVVQHLESITGLRYKYRTLLGTSWLGASMCRRTRLASSASPSGILFARHFFQFVAYLPPFCILLPYFLCFS